MMRLEHITKIYNEKVDNTKALDDVSLTIQDGEFVAVMGPSGSGKSTLLNIIGCMDNATSGDYYMDEIKVSSLSGADMNAFRRKNIGFVFQHFALMDYYTAYENIELPLVAQNVRASERKKRVLAAMEQLDIQELRNKRPGKMSGGQQQRVAIARALVTGCKILLADEPTGALDQATGQEVMNLLRKVNENGTTVIVVTHDENIAKQMNRVIRICDGKVVQDTVA